MRSRSSTIFAASIPDPFTASLSRIPLSPSLSVYDVIP